MCFGSPLPVLPRVAAVTVSNSLRVRVLLKSTGLVGLRNTPEAIGTFRFRHKCACSSSGDVCVVLDPHGNVDGGSYWPSEAGVDHVAMVR